MREIFSLRFFAAIGGVVGLFLLVSAVVVGRDTIASTPEAPPIARRIDLVSPILLPVLTDFEVIDGVVSGEAVFILENGGRPRLVPGTHGEVECSLQRPPGSCVLFAQVLGDAVVWFQIVPGRPDGTVELPAIDELGRDTATLVNGWQLAYANRFERRCERDFDSYRQLRAELGDRFNSVYSIEDQELVAVECLE